MTETYLDGFYTLNVWKRSDERAPHKPLLALWAIGRCLQGKNRLADYEIVHRELLSLLRSFGAPRRRHKPQEPFWRMRKNEIWEIPQAEHITEHPNGSVSPSQLRDQNIQGGFPAFLYNTFRRDKAIALKVAEYLVNSHFPETMRLAVLEATLGGNAIEGILSQSRQVDNDQSPLLNSALNRRSRSPKFRKTVLSKYEYRCAVCKYSFEFPRGNWPALEAAHIKWHSHRGPDDAQNGLSLCVLHHELFDWGAFTILPNTFDILVARTILNQVCKSPITSLQGTPLPIIPERDSDQPAAEYLDWHARNVFRKY